MGDVRCEGVIEGTIKDGECKATLLFHCMRSVQVVWGTFGARGSLKVRIKDGECKATLLFIVLRSVQVLWGMLMQCEEVIEG